MIQTSHTRPVIVLGRAIVRCMSGASVTGGMISRERKEGERELHVLVVDDARAIVADETRSPSNLLLAHSTSLVRIGSGSSIAWSHVSQRCLDYELRS